MWEGRDTRLHKAKTKWGKANEGSKAVNNVLSRYVGPVGVGSGCGNTSALVSWSLDASRTVVIPTTWELQPNVA